MSLTEEECSICFEKLNNNIAHLSCNHFFHYYCIRKWVEQQKQKQKQTRTQNINILCPLCNQIFEIINLYLPSDDDILINFFDENTKNIKHTKKNQSCIIL